MSNIPIHPISGSKKRKFCLSEDPFVQQVNKVRRNNEIAGPKLPVQDQCGACLLETRFCMCHLIPDPSSLVSSLTSMFDVVIYSHYAEVENISCSNTGRWLMWSGARSVLMGYSEQEVKLRDDILRRTRGSVCVLFPSKDAITPEEFSSRMPLSFVDAVTRSQQNLSSSGDATTMVNNHVSGSESSSVDEDGLFPHSSPDTPLVIVVDGTWNRAKGVNRRLDLLLSEVVSESEELSSGDGSVLPYLTRVRLSRSFRGDIGSLRRVSTSEKNKVKYLDQHNISFGSHSGADGELSQVQHNTVLTEDDSLKVSTLQAYMVFLEEVFDLPEGSYRGTYQRLRREWALAVNDREREEETCSRDTAKETIQETVSSKDSQNLPPIDNPIDLTSLSPVQLVMQEVVSKLAYILRTTVIHYHAKTFLQKAELLPPETLNEVIQLLKKKEVEREGDMENKKERRRVRLVQEGRVTEDGVWKD